MNQPRRLAAGAAHQFGGIAIDRSKPLQFRIDGRRVAGFAGDTVLSALLAAGIDGYGTFGSAVLGLGERFAPLVQVRGGQALPMDRLLAADGMDLQTIGARRLFHQGRTLGHRIAGIAAPPWTQQGVETTLAVDVLVVGGGVAGLAAADAAACAWHSVVLAERRTWLGGDARYFGPVGDEASPESVSADLIARVHGHGAITVMTAAEVFALHGTTAHLHRIVDGAGHVVAVSAKRVVLATGSRQRLPLFGGNRLPGVTSAIAAYHMAKRHGVMPGRKTVVATQSNYGYRLAMRLHDAGVAVPRVVDTRINPQSRFVDFAKASGLHLAGGVQPLSAAAGRSGLTLQFANSGTATRTIEIEADALVVSGPFYPDLSLWMLAGGWTQWRDGGLRARGTLEHIVLAGAAVGYRSLAACVASGPAALAQAFGTRADSIEDFELGAPYETPEAPTPIAPPTGTEPAFYDWGTSLISRPDPQWKPPLTPHAQAPTLGDVAASVDLGLTAAADAGAVAEERGAPGADIVASVWNAPASAPQPQSARWLSQRFGDATEELHLVVDGKRRFMRGALVYANDRRGDPTAAIGVIIREGEPAGGVALISSVALRKADRFVVEALDGPSPARIKRD